MFRVYLQNFGYFLEPHFNTIKDAVQYGKSKGFEFIVFFNDTTVGSAMGPSLSFHINNSDYHHRI